MKREKAQTSGRAIFWRRRTVRFWLGILVVAMVLPAMGIACGLTVLDYRRERANLEAARISTARALTQAVDQELAGVQSALQTLAISSYLETGNLSAFYDQSREVLRFVHANNVVLADRSGQQVLNTLKAYGEVLPMHGDLELQRKVVATGRAVISDVFTGAVAKRPLIDVEVPVFIRGEIVYTLAMGIFPERLSEILSRQKIAPDRVVVIFDRTGTVVARTHNSEQFVGNKGSPELVRRLAETEEGVIDVDTLEGIPVTTSFSRSSVSGWSVAIGIPRAGPLGDLRRSLLLNAAIAALLLLLGLAMARTISLRIINAIRSLRGPALALGSPVPLAVPPTEIEEVDELGQALVKASELIEQRAAERDAATTAERRITVAKEAAEQANRTKSEFLAMMSHELRTPLNAVLGFAQLLESPHFGPLTGKQREFVGHIVSGGSYLLELINDVLDLSKVEAGRLTVSIEEVDIFPVMTSVIATLKRQAEQSEIALVAGHFGKTMPPVMADRVRLAQALINLGSNAIKYNRTGGSVTFSYERISDSNVRITVADTGMGIPADQQPGLFQPFNRLGAEARAIEGTGIGLALTRRLIELMGGSIGFSSIVGEGSRFLIDFPRYKAESVEIRSATPAIPAVRPSGFSILYIEDNPANVALIRNIVATLDDVRFLEAKDGSTGIALAKLYRPDLIMLDINLPDLNGYVVMQRLKREPELKATPVLALSAGAMPGEIGRGIEAGFFRYLTKPVDVGKLLDAIGAALSKSSSDHASTTTPQRSEQAPCA